MEENKWDGEVGYFWYKELPAKDWELVYISGNGYILKLGESSSSHVEYGQPQFKRVNIRAPKG